MIGASSWHWSHGPSLGADDHGQYLLHARNLVEGRPYTDIGFIHSAFTGLTGPIAEPPALPALIAIVFTAAGESLPWVRVLLIAIFLAFTIAVWLYWHRLESDTIAFLVTAWCVVAFTRLHVVDTVLSDVPFAAAIWWAFVIADSPNERRSLGRYGAFALAGALAFGFRMAALPLLPAIVTYTVVRPVEERGKLALVGAVWLLSACGVLFMLPGAEALGGESVRTLADVIRDVGINARTLSDGARQWVPIILPWRSVNIAVQATLLAIAAIGAVAAFAEHPRRFAYIAAAWYLVMLLALPTRAARYMWPMYPFITFALIRGVRWIAQRVRPALGTRLAPLGSAAMIALLAAGLVQDVMRPPPRTLRDDRETQEIVEALKAAAQEGPVRAVFFSPRVLTWETGITATAFGRGTPDEILGEVRRSSLTHIAVGDAGTVAQGNAETVAMVAAHRDAFYPILTNASFVLYQVRADTSTTR